MELIDKLRRLNTKYRSKFDFEYYKKYIEDELIKSARDGGTYCEFNFQFIKVDDDRLLIKKEDLKKLIKYYNIIDNDCGYSKTYGHIYFRFPYLTDEELKQQNFDEAILEELGD